MPRKGPAPRPVPPHVVHDNAVYTLEAAAGAFGLPPTCVRVAAREGRLRVFELSNRYYTYGVWLREWFDAHRRPAAAGG